MTKEDIVLFDKMKKNYVQPYKSNGNSLVSLFIDSSTSDTTIVSDLTPTTSPNNHSTVISLKYSSGNSAMALDTLVGAQDLNEARERNKKKKKKEKGIEALNKYKQATAVTVMFHFQKIGCKIGKTALDKKREM